VADELTLQKTAWQRVREYVSDVRIEMRRVTWPSKQEIYGTTVMVILTTFLFAFYFWICDSIFGALTRKGLNFLLHRH
jgi:preprotein translocase subunit SecE